MDNVQIILLNGASSSGKSTLAKALQAQLETPHVTLAEDDFWFKLPEGDHPFEVRYRLYYGFMSCIAALAERGNYVIVDTVADDRDALREFARLLSPYRVLFVGVHCALPVLEEREQARGDRTPGTARRQFEHVHTHTPYDIEVDTSQATLIECIESILAARNQPQTPSTFERLCQPIG